MSESKPQGRVTLYWSVKGGVGTSTVAAAAAIRHASEDREVVLVDLAGDQPALLGMVRTAPADEPGIHDWACADNAAPDALDRLTESVGPGLSLMRRGTYPTVPVGRLPRLVEALDHLSRTADVVVDAGLDPDGLRSEMDGRGSPICVLRACYLALSRCQFLPGPYDRVVLVEEPERALRVRDVAAAVGAEDVSRIQFDPRVGRAVDAGTIVSMLPPPLRLWEMPA